MNFRTKCVHTKDFYGNISMGVLTDLNPERYGRLCNNHTNTLKNQMMDLYGAKFGFLTGCGAQALNLLMTVFNHNKRFHKLYFDKRCYCEFISSADMFEYNYELIDYETFDFSKAKSPSVFFIEPLTNPYLFEVDVKKICKTVHKINPLNIVVVDNTIYTSYYYNPFDDGADMVVESLTKYTNGFGDAFGGVILYKKNIFNKQLFVYNIDRLFNLATHISPLESYLISRSISTLPIRMDYITNSATKIYEYLKTKSPLVKYSGKGGFIILNLNNLSDKKDLNNMLVENLKLFTHCMAFGHDYSLYYVIKEWFPIERECPNEDFKNCIRFSIGLEDTDDLIEDLEQAFKQIGL